MYQEILTLGSFSEPLTFQEEISHGCYPQVRYTLERRHHNQCQPHVRDMGKITLATYNNTICRELGNNTYR